MTKKMSETQALELMEEAFSAEKHDAVQQRLDLLLAAQPEFQGLWEEFLNLRRGLQHLESLAQPSEITRARILQAAKHPVKRAAGRRPSKIWRVLLSQPVVAAATVALFVGFGIYTHYWRQDPARSLPTIPAPVPSPTVVKPTSPPPPSNGEADSVTSGSPKGDSRAPLENTIKRRQGPILQKAQPTTPQKVLPPAPSPVQTEEAPNLAPVGSATSSPPPPVKALGGQGLERAKTKPGEAEGSLRDQAQDQPSTDKYLEESREAPTEPEMKAKKETQAPAAEPVPALVEHAKTLMAAEKYDEALIKLKQAQQIEDTKEIRRLIAQCRAALMKQQLKSVRD